MGYTYIVSSKVNPANGKVMDLIRYDSEGVLVPRKYFEVWEPDETGLLGEWKRYYQGFMIQSAFSVSDPVGINEADLPAGVKLSDKIKTDGLASLDMAMKKVVAVRTSIFHAQLYLQRQGK